jgi:hypothetical protein
MHDAGYLLVQPIMGAWSAGFTIVRRGYDRRQVDDRIRWLEVQIKILVADRDSAMEHLELTELRLNAALNEVARCRSEMRVMTTAPETVESMNDRLQAIMRESQDEFAAIQVDAASYTARIIASVRQEVASAVKTAERPRSEGTGPAGRSRDLHEEPVRDRLADVEHEVARIRREAQQERTRLWEEAVAKRAQAEERFRLALTLRCRQALAQLTQLHADTLRAVHKVRADVDEQARVSVAEAAETARSMVADAQREVDHLRATRDQLHRSLASARTSLNSVLRLAASQRDARNTVSAAGSGPSHGHSIRT